MCHILPQQFIVDPKISKKETEKYRRAITECDRIKDGGVLRQGSCFIVILIGSHPLL